MPATRVYFPTNATAAVSPAIDAGWETTTVVRGRLVTTRTSSGFTIDHSTQGGGANRDSIWFQFVSDPISTAGAAELAATPGTVKGIFRVTQSNSNEDCQAQMLIKVVSNDGATVRGTLLAMDTTALSNEFPTVSNGYTNRKFPKAWAGAGTALTAVASAVANDRVVVEVGFRTTQAAQVADGRVEYGDSSPTDLAENETGQIQDNPWVEFSADLFGATQAARQADVSWVEIEVPSPLSGSTNVLRLFQADFVDEIIPPDSILGQTDIVLVQYGVLQNDPGLVSRLKAINPNLKVVLYWFPQVVLPGSQQFMTPVVRDAIFANNWLLHNPEGDTTTATRVRHPYSGSTLYMVDMRIAAYRQVVIDEVLNTWIIPYGLDGYFNDGAGYVTGLHGLGPWDVKPTDGQIATFRGDNSTTPTPNVNFFTELNTALGSRLCLGAHWHPWTQAANYADMIQFFNVDGRSDGHSMEACFHRGGATEFENEVTEIDHHLDKFQKTLALGKTSVAFSRTSGGLTTAQIDTIHRFCFAMYLMQADGANHYFGLWAPPYHWTQARIDYMETNAVALGAPLQTGDTSYTVESGTTSVLRRDFSGGYVRVNKHASQTQGGLAPHGNEIVLTPPSTARAADVSQVEVEVPDVAADRIADVSQVEIEVPDVANRAADVSQVEIEFPDADRSADVSWVELQVPSSVTEVLPPTFGGGDFPDPSQTQFDPTFRPFPSDPTHPGSPQFPS